MKSSIKTINQEICPCCGQTINRREIIPTKILVKALVDILKYCKTNNRTEFTREEIKPFLLKMGNETITATFGNWKFFGAGMIWSVSRGNWKIDPVKVALFLKGQYNIPTRVLKKNGTNYVEVIESGSVYDIKGVEEVITPDGQFPLNYRA